MAESSEAVFGKTQTLAHLLEFLSRLQEKPDVRKKVIEEIKEKVEAYVKDDDQQFGNPTTGNLFETIKQSTELRKNILKPEQETQYKHYNTQFQDSAAHKYTELLINNIFALFGCLYYMYYECAQQCSDIKGGEWYDERCDGKGGYQYLNQWLKDQKPSTETSEGGTDTPEDGTKRMIQRGFQEGELGNKKGEYLFPGSGSQSLLDYQYGAQLQFCLYYMLFLPKKWNDAQSGHAVLFLEAFCEKVSENKFNGQQTAAADGGTFKTACQKVQESINTLTGLSMIVPVAWSPKVNYKDLLDRKHFWNYIDWLKKHLDKLIASLTEMANDASNWTETSLMTSKSFGPFPWGFTFKHHNWEHKTKHFKSKLKEPLSELIQELEKLKNALPSASEAKTVSKGDTEESSTSSVSTNSAEKPSSSSASTTSTTSNNSTDSTDSNDSTTSTASTIGGVAGGLGAAAATGAAAYAGSGFVGPVAESIGRFFRGLLF